MGILLAATLSLIASSSVAPAAGADRIDIDYTQFDLNELLNMDVVYGASKYVQKISEAPSAVTVITAEEIRAFGYRSLGEVLATVPGLYLSDDLNYQFTGVRGFSRPGDYNTRLLLIVDGHRINDNVYLSAPTGLEFPLDLSLIQRIEIIKGPSSSLYGTSAFFGVVNIITYGGGDLPGSRLLLGGASFGTWEGVLSYGGHAGREGRFLVAMKGFDSQGRDHYFPEFDAPETNLGVYEDNDRHRSSNLFAKLEFGDLTFSGVHGSRYKEVPSASFETVFNHPDASTLDERSYFDLQFDRTFDGGSRILASLAYDRCVYRGIYPYDYSEEEDGSEIVLSRDLSAGNWLSANARFEHSLGAAHHLIGGLEAQNDFHIDQSLFDEGPWAEYLDDHRSGSYWGAYIQDDWRIMPGLRVNLGLRHDRYESFGGTSNPRIGLILSPRRHTHLKVLAGRAFRAPSAYEMYYHDDGETQKPSRDLQPESIVSREFIWEQSFSPRWKTSLSVYSYTIDDLISQVSDQDDGLLVYRNFERVLSRGVELEVDARLRLGFSGRASASLQKTHLEGEDDPLSNSPRWLLKANLLSPRFLGEFRSGLELQHGGERATLAGAESDPVTRVNLSLENWRDFGALGFRLSVMNLFDTDYAYPGSEEHSQDLLGQEGRSYRLQLGLSW